MNYCTLFPVTKGGIMSNILESYHREDQVTNHRNVQDLSCWVRISLRMNPNSHSAMANWRNKLGRNNQARRFSNIGSRTKCSLVNQCSDTNIESLNKWKTPEHHEYFKEFLVRPSVLRLWRPSVTESLGTRLCSARTSREGSTPPAHVHLLLFSFLWR